MFDAQSLYGATPQAPSYQTPAPVTQQMSSGDLPTGVKGLLHPDNPLFWFGAVLAVTLGAVGVAGSVRLGRAKLSASLDQA